MPGGVGEEVVQDLDDALAVGHHPGQVRRQVDAHGVPGAGGAAQERLSRLVHEPGHRQRLSGDRQRARLDAPGVEEVVDEPAHVMGLLVDDAEELVHLGRVQPRGGAQQGGGRADDGGQRRPQLVADHGQELGPQPLQLLELGEVLQGDDDRLDAAVLGPDRRGVDEGPDAAAIGDGELDLLGADGLGVAELLRQGELCEGDLPAVCAAARDHPEQLLGGTVRRAQAGDDALGLAVERYRPAGAGVEDHDADRGCLDQGLQAGPRPLLPPMRAGVGDGRRRLRREEHQHLFVLIGELLPAGLVGEEEVTDVHVPVPHRRPLQAPQQGPRREQVGGEAERTDVVARLAEPQRTRQVAEVLEELRPVRPGGHLLVFFGRDAGGDEVAGLSALVDGRDAAVSGPGKGAGGLDDLVQDGVEVEAGADAEDGGAELGDAVSQRLVLSPQIVGVGHDRLLRFIDSRKRPHVTR